MSAPIYGCSRHKTIMPCNCYVNKMRRLETKLTTTLQLLAKERDEFGDKETKLLSRLECAEAICRIVEKHGDGSLWNECEAWRKSKEGR